MMHCGRIVVPALLPAIAVSAPAQAPTARGPRTPDRKPDLNGIWQTFSTANRDVQDHAAYAGPMSQTGAIGAVPPGPGVVVGDEVPYLPAAAATKKENRLVNMAKPKEAGADSWTGTSNGYREGGTLLVDVTGLNGLAWKIVVPLYRRTEKNLQLIEFKCVPFSEELLYGEFRKQSSR